MNKIINTLKNYVFVIRMKRLKRKADKLREITHSQQFILMKGGRISIVSKEWFKEQRQKGKFPKTFTAENLKKISFYYTKQ